MPDPVVVRWRDVRYHHIYEFLPGGLGRFELFVLPEEDPMLSAVLTPEVSWRRVIVQRNRAEIQGGRLVTEVRQREGTLTLERVR